MSDQPMTSVSQPLPIVLLGAGGHGKVLLALLRSLSLEVLGVSDPQLAGKVADWQGIPVLGGDEALDHLDPATVGLVNGVGQVVGSSRRADIFYALRARGFRFPALVHPSAWVAPDVKLDEGVQIMAGAVVQPGVEIGANSVINSRASVDHDCIIGMCVHVAPGAVLCGGVNVASGAFVGAGATVVQGLMLGEKAVVGAGATVVRDLPGGHLIIGSPARIQPSRFL
ncbi:acetyltransferase [Pseudomonas soli]|nr:acetyltransferase [Pseudomonas soli]